MTVDGMIATTTVTGTIVIIEIDEIATTIDIGTTVIEEMTATIEDAETIAMIGIPEIVMTTDREIGMMIGGGIGNW